MTPRPYDSTRWRRLRPVIAERDGWRCQLCRKPVTPDSYDVDHIIPWQESGRGRWFDPTNLRTLCPPCNRGRPQERLARMAHINRTPATEPSRRW